MTVRINGSTGYTNGDNVKLKLGASDDLQIYHSGNHSWINDNGTGQLYIQSNGAAINVTNSSTRNLAQFNTSAGTVTLYHDNGTTSSAKLATTSTGIDVTGRITTDELYVDSSGSINSGSSAGTLTLYGGNTNKGGMIVLDGGNNDGDIVFHAEQYQASPKQRMQIANNGDISFYEDTGTTAKFFWDASAESLGIGTSTVQNIIAGRTILQIDNTSSALINFSTGLTRRGFVYATTTAFDLYSDSAIPLRLGTNDTERMRIDSSGNLLVGQTAGSTSAPGTIITASGKSYHIATSDFALALDRKTTDGTILELRRDQTVIGQIGVASSKLHIGTGNANFRFRDDLTAIIPANSDGTNSDADIDLGYSTVRWRRLYLSEGMYVGGTSTANRLDDYEEGSFTPVITNTGTAPTRTHSIQFGRYTKTGNQVYFELSAKLSSYSAGSGEVVITGLPFSVANVASYQHPTFTMNIVLNNSSDVWQALGNATPAVFFRKLNTSSDIGMGTSEIGGSTAFLISGVYHTTA